MTKQDISEIKKLFTPRNCSITRICGCYVDGEKNKKTELKQAFLALPEEEMFKYFEILRKVLSGTPGKNLLTLEFPLALEMAGMDMSASPADGPVLQEKTTSDMIETDESPQDTPDSGTNGTESSLPQAILPDERIPETPPNAHQFLMRLKESKL